MKAIVITLIACATAISCVVLVLLRVEHAPAQPRFQLYNVDDTSEASGKTVKWIYRLDTVSGKTWRMSSNPAVMSEDAQHKPIIATWGDGWEEMPESPEAAVAKAQAEFRHAATMQPTASPAR